MRRMQGTIQKPSGSELILLLVTSTAHTAIITLSLTQSSPRHDYTLKVKMLVWTTGMSSSQGLMIDRMLTISSMLKDERVARDKERSLFNIRDVSDRMG